MKYYEYNTTILNGLWWGISRGFMFGCIPVLSQVVLIDFLFTEIKLKNKMTAYSVGIALIVSFWPLILLCI